MPFTGCTLDLSDPGTFSPEVATGRRDLNIYPLQGQIKLAGAIDGPLHPFSGAPLLVGSIGADTGQGGSVPGVLKQGTVAAAAAGAVVLVYTVTGGTAIPVIGDLFQIGPAIATYGSAASLVAGTQIVKVTAVGGAGPYNLTVAPLQAKVDTVGNGAAGLVAQAVIAPFTHQIAYANTLPSFTVEKNIGGHESLQFAGTRVNKFTLKGSATNEAINYSADVMSKAVAVLGVPSPLLDDTSMPWVFAEAQLSAFGTPLGQMSAFQLDIDNGVKDTYTFNQTHLPNFLTPCSFAATGNVNVVWTSLDDVTWGYYTQAYTQVQGALAMTFTHLAGGLETFTLTLPEIVLDKYKDDIKTKDLVMSTLNFRAFYQFSSGTRIAGVLVNSQFAGY